MGSQYNLTFLYFLFGFGLALLCGLWARKVAIRKSRDPMLWFLLGFFLLFLGVLLTYLVPTVHRYEHTEVEGPEEPPRDLEIELTRCPHCGASIPTDARMCGICGDPVDTG